MASARKRRPRPPRKRAPASPGPTRGGKATRPTKRTTRTQAARSAKPTGPTKAELETRLTLAERRLSEAADQQAAAAEILRAISQAQADVQPVFEAIAKSSVRLCRGLFGAVYRFDGTLMDLAAQHGLPPDALALLRRDYPVTPRGIIGRVLVEQDVVNVADVSTDPRVTNRPFAETLGARSSLVVPMLREGRSVGAIAVFRPEPGLFSDTHIALLRAFADQAVIAIENVHLFHELQAKNVDLAEALDQQTATAEILRVISSSPSDAQPVFEAIIHSAVRLCSARFGAVYRYDGALIHLAAHYNFDGDALASLTQRFPQPPGDDSLVGRAIQRGSPIEIRDATRDPDVPAGPRVTALALGYRGHLIVPMIRQGAPIGAIAVAREEAETFPPEAVALLKTFADQAVIAIENARLFAALQEKNRTLTGTLEQQTATSDILRVISSCPGDIQPVFDAIAASAARLCDAVNGLVITFDGQLLHLAAHYNVDPERLDAVRRAYPRAPSRGALSGRAILTRAVVHVPDVSEDPEYTLPAATTIGYRSVLAVPMMHEGVPRGTILIAREVVAPFSDAHIGLIQTFAEQAVIAIENVRLFNETKEALERQTATAEVLQIISNSVADARPVLDKILESCTRLIPAQSLGVNLVGDDGRLHLGAALNVGLDGEPGWTKPELDAIAKMAASLYPMALEGTGTAAAIHCGRVLNYPDVLDGDDVPLGVSAIARRLGRSYSQMMAPLMQGERGIGSIAVIRAALGGFTEKEQSLLKTFADHAVIAIQNARLFNETKEALERQTATAEILKVIAGSPSDVQPVFDTIAESAMRLCGGLYGAVFLVEDEVVQCVAHHGFREEDLAAFRRYYPQPVSAVSGVLGRAVREKRVAHSADVRAEPDAHELAPVLGHRSLIVAPMLRDGRVVGTVSVARAHIEPFSDAQVALLQTFADQAVIAIENARILKELEARTAELTRSVSQLVALGDVGRAVSSSLDLDTVLATIVSRAVELTGLEAGAIYEYDERTETFDLRATERLGEDEVHVLRTVPLRRGEGAVGQTAVTLGPIQVPDITDTRLYESRLRDLLIRAGHRALLAVPLLRENQLVGALVVNRKTPGVFPPEVVELLRTFATQSALAIQNARLFREIEDKSRQLELASRHKSQFLASMSHELRTPLNAILGLNEMLLGEVYGEVPEDMKPPLVQTQASGRHLLGLINNVLDLAKIEANRLELALGPYVVQDLVASVRATLAPLAAEKGLAFTASASDDLPVAHGDAGRLTQCLINLAGNAVKFTKAGRVELRVEPVADRLRFSVADTGIGIAPDKMSDLFTEFKQTDATIAREYGGTGLGLAITRKFIELHQGSIWVESELGRGSTFIFEIPLKVPA